MQDLYQSERPLKLTIGTPGLLETFAIEDDAVALSELGPDEVEFEVKASGINFRIIMICSGQLADNSLGLEGAGVVTRVGSAVENMHNAKE
jgi:NADPH:quinone reductase-like Zn-dependent oxidoreductase